MGILDLAGRVLEAKLDDAARAHAPKPPRVDVGLPLNAQIGALLDLPRAEFAVLSGSLLTVPKAGQMPIVAVSRIRFARTDEYTLFRFYTDLGADRTAGGQRFLQLLVNASDLADIRDITYYQFLCRQFPVSDDEQAPFRGEGFGLGERNYDMAEDLLATMPHVCGAIGALLAGSDAIRFTRDSSGPEYVRPYAGQENRLDDPVGEKGMTKQVSFMPYVRNLEGGRQERLLITFDYVETLDGRPAQAVYVDYLAGLTIDRNKIRVL
ncbi:DUF2491 family protein [Burkholderia cepacia]|uniref:DUF2491 family protein n=1 Tax=Burkholderia cepacia TaxID=292 RepID=UPI002AB6B054|nr:DUF2491 family protein [Burkholderia cepacia]